MNPSLSDVTGVKYHLSTLYCLFTQVLSAAFDLKWNHFRFHLGLASKLDIYILLLRILNFVSDVRSLELA